MNSDACWAFAGFSAGRWGFGGSQVLNTHIYIYIYTYLEVLM